MRPRKTTAAASAESRPRSVSDTAAARRRGLKYVLMLGALAALPAVTTDMYLPALPAVAEDLETTAAAAQFTLSGTLLGAAVGQLVIGPFSDRVGRRLPLLLGISLHVLVSLLCSVVPNIETLIGLRVLQGFFNAAAGVVAIAVIRDRFQGSDAARMLSRLMLIIGLAPLLAPTLGQAVIAVWQWRAVFLALALIGVVLVVIVWRWMPETLPPHRRARAAAAAETAEAARAAAAGEDAAAARPRGYRVLLRDRRFLSLAVLPGLGMGVIMSYVVGSPFVFQEQYGFSPAQFAGIFAFNGVAMVVTAQVNAALVQRAAPLRILRTAAPAMLVLALLLPLVISLDLGGVVGLIAVLWLVLGMQGFIMANASALALNDYGHMAGTAAALIGCLQVGLAGLISPLVGLLGSSALDLSVVVIGCATLMVLILAFGASAYSRRGPGTRRSLRRPPAAAGN
ncbi:Bicyclomycin resistance protein [Arthrobacter saudimassiliensis]|uniref:Bicyclomycin resistance protein n=1 Tax=Arthrobacter saudimassiliensis TaxID=1461584 RepID=A0A078MXN1_9MICC|nr:Bicyclomycin resistance protein [Arthrobacter saudimassiliensis]